MSLSVWEKEKEKGTLSGETGPLNGFHVWSIPFVLFGSYIYRVAEKYSCQVPTGSG